MRMFRGQELRLISFIYLMMSVFCCDLFARDKIGFPERIISLGPAVTEKLYLLEAGDRLIANTLYCQRPPEAKNKEKIGTVTKADMEKVVALKPDLVLATSLTNPEQVEKMKSLGLRVVIFPQPESFSELCKQFLKLGKIAGRYKKAKEIIKQVRARVDAIKKNVKDFSKTKVFVQIGAKPLFTVTKDSFLNDFIEFGGGINIAWRAKTGLYSREKVLQSNPDVIIIVPMGIAGEQEKEIWQKFKTLNATRNNRIHIIDSYKICSPTPAGFVDTLRELAGLLHPDEIRKKKVE